jgi:two-component system, cell cycle sensor histidine kinase and response regulator CckA
MKYLLFHSVALSLLPCLIPFYAFRLSRVFGTKRVGWILFAVFSSLAALQLIHSLEPLNFGVDPRITLDLLNFLIPMLLLIGMIHLETVFRGRLRLEEEEKRLRDGLEAQVKERTAALDAANEELQQEISLRKQGTAELRASKEQYRFLFDENPQPMWIFDLGSLRFLAFNRAALRQYGFASTEFRDMSAKDLVPSAEVEAFIADSAKTIPGVHKRGLWRHLKKDGTLVEVEITAQDLVYGGSAARLVLANDVTAQRLLHKQLLQAKKTEVTAQLAGGVADNFNRLINAIEGDANALVQKCQDPAAAEPLRRIAATAGSAAGLTRQLLALVRRHPMRPRALDLNKLIEDYTGTVERLIGKRIRLEKLCWGNLPSIMADPGVVLQILRILVLNALDAMPEGGLLTLSTAAVRVDAAHAASQEGGRPGAYVCLTVADTGCGMTPEVQARLFEPFFTTKAAGKGTGLGLATLQGLVRQHFGWVEVNSQHGGGSEFTVFFPCLSGSASRPQVKNCEMEAEPAEKA